MFSIIFGFIIFAFGVRRVHTTFNIKTELAIKRAVIAAHKKGHTDVTFEETAAIYRWLKPTLLVVWVFLVALGFHMILSGWYSL